MSTSTLSAHSPKFNSFLTDRAGLARLPQPEPLGRMHRPVPHSVLVDAISAEVERRGYRELRSSFALGKNTTAIFGVIDLEPTGLNSASLGLAVRNANPDRTLSLGFRSSNDRSMAIKMVAGTRVFVCDNLSMMGDLIAMKRMHTTGLDLGEAVASGFDRFLTHSDILESHMVRLQSTSLTDSAARDLAFRVFSNHIVPSRLLDDVDRFYFRPDENMTDCTPRSLYGLHSAFTRAMHDLTPVRAFSATTALGKFFGMQVADRALLNA